MNYEYNTIIKDWRNIDLSFGLVYPNVYKIGMSSYTIRFLYSFINSFNNIVCERFFLPEKKRFPASKDYQSEDYIRSVENKIPPKRFDILGLSIQFENDYKNILWFLEKAGIPISNKIRMKEIIKNKSYYPLIIGGGPVIKSNPIPLSEIFDVCFIGDAEPNLPSFLKSFIDYKFNNHNLEVYLKNLLNIKGLYIPILNNKVERIFIEDLNNSPIPIDQIRAEMTSNKKVFEESFFIEVNRGCPYQCKFCISSHHNSPFRNRSLNEIKEVIEKAVNNSEFTTISLIGSCISAHPNFYEICEFIINKEKRITIPSIRIDHLSPKIIDILEKGNIKTITIAPETGSENLRYQLGKKISNEKIHNIFNLIKNSKIKNVKMYFLIGIPNEKKSDIESIINMIEDIDKLRFGKNAIRVSINPLIPKLNTPYEKEVDIFLEEYKFNLKMKFDLIQRKLKKLASVNLKLQNINSLIKNAKLQTLISLGNQKVSKLLINYYQNGANFGALRKSEKIINFSINDYFLKVKNCYSPWLLN